MNDKFLLELSQRPANIVAQRLCIQAIGHFVSFVIRYIRIGTSVEWKKPVCSSGGGDSNGICSVLNRFFPRHM